MLLKMSELAYFNLPDSPEQIGLAVFAVTRGSSCARVNVVDASARVGIATACRIDECPLKL